MFLRRSLPFLAATIILLLAVIEGGGFLREQIAIATLEEAPSDSPNVLFIVVDTLRADHLRRNEARNFMFLRRSLPFLAATIILLLAVIEGGGFLREQIAIATLEEAPSDSPNVLFIVVDTLRADHLRRNEARNFMFLRRSLPFLAATIILLLAVIEGGGFLREQIAIATLEEAPSDSPNVLFIVVDTLRADHLGTYGYERNTSPNIDRLADEGVVFESAFSTSSWTAPSHASMFTGTYMNEHNTQFSVSLSILGLVSKK